MVWLEKNVAQLNYCTVWVSKITKTLWQVIQMTSLKVRAKKVMIAVAVANQPRLLIADEPTNSLESITALQIFRLLSSMNQNQGTTILLASNDLKSISDGVIVFPSFIVGKIQSLGQPTKY